MRIPDRAVILSREHIGKECQRHPRRLVEVLLRNTEAGEHCEAGMDPGEEVVHEGFRQAFGLVQQEKAKGDFP
jgi:hypothetical protein